MLVTHPRVAAVLRATFVAGLLGSAAAVGAQQVPILQPGAPGQPTRVLTPADANRVADTRYSPDDVRFMQMMIPHHAQATEMAALVKDRTSRQSVLDVARRIDAAQGDEIAFMKNWLTRRAQPVTDPHAGHMMHDAAAMAQHHAKMAWRRPPRWRRWRPRRARRSSGSSSSG